MKNTDSGAGRPQPILYVSFDQVPAAKGASTHIEAFVAALGRRFGTVVLATPGPRDEPVRAFAEGVRKVVLGCPDGDVLGRVFTFRAKLRALLDRQAFDLIHFRSPLEGYPLARRKDQFGARLLYEVNGLPSVELPHAHPRLRGDLRLIDKLRRQEEACLAAADHVITVSEVNRRHLLARGGVAAEKVSVIRNGVDLTCFPYRPPPTVAEGEALRVLYSGTLSAWQGVEVLLDALPLVAQHRPVRLTLAGPAPRARRAELQRRAHRLGVAGRVSFLGPVPRRRVAELLHESHAAVVPLTAADRNTVQGCCPLKLLEAMAAGCPVVASDLPVVRELASPGEHFVPVAPDDPAGLALGLWRVAGDHAAAMRLSQQARRHAAASLRWEQATEALVRVAEGLLQE